MLFDNKTKDEMKRVEQVEQLLSLVTGIIIQNGGHPYTDELFTELKVLLNHTGFFTIVSGTKPLQQINLAGRGYETS